jgi:hypothetical protein
MRREDDQELWDLLGHLKPPPRLSAFFGRDVIRRLRQEPRVFDQLRTSFSLRWLIPASALAAAIIAVVTVVQHPRPRPPVSETLPEAVAKIDPQDYEVVADLDVLLASDENSLWDENQSL